MAYKNSVDRYKDGENGPPIKLVDTILELTNNITFLGIRFYNKGILYEKKKLNNEIMKLRRFLEYASAQFRYDHIEKTKENAEFIISNEEKKTEEERSQYKLTKYGRKLKHANKVIDFYETKVKNQEKNDVSREYNK